MKSKICIESWIFFLLKENGVGEVGANEKNHAGSLLTVSNITNKSQLRYQYSFTDSIILDDFSSLNDFKVKLF